MDHEFYKRAFSHAVTGEPRPIPPVLRNIAITICEHYNIKGICDPMYIVNRAAAIVSAGDGQSSFFRSRINFGPHEIEKLADVLISCYGCNIGPGDKAILTSLIEYAVDEANPTNEERGAHGLAAIKVGSGNPDARGNGAEIEEAVIDTLANIMHYCYVSDVDFANAVGCAETHFTQEV